MLCSLLLRSLSLTAWLHISTNLRNLYSPRGSVRNSEVMAIITFIQLQVAVTSRFLKKPSEIAPRFQSQRYFKFLDSTSDPRTKQGVFIGEVRIWDRHCVDGFILINGETSDIFFLVCFSWQQESWRKNKHHVTARGSLKRWKFRILCPWFSKMRAQKYDVRKVCLVFEIIGGY